MERLLAKSGVRGIKSYMVLPPRNEMMEGELKQRIKDSTLDGVLIVRPKAARQDTEEVVTGAVYAPPAGYYTFWPVILLLTLMGMAQPRHRSHLPCLRRHTRSLDEVKNRPATASQIARGRSEEI
jgi:hypothetical protein